MVRLADAVVVGRDRRVWAPDGSGAPVDAAGARLAPGAAVVVGPAGADVDRQRAALRALADLVAAGGTLAAGAGVELTPGFRSGRLDGGRGDRRDAILAALPVLGVDGLARLGPRAAVLVALFGPAATKRVGARAGDAVREGRWGALRLASAASDVLGPEQLERLLDLAEPPGVDPAGYGSATALAGHLRDVLADLPTPRRLTLLLDLWRLVGEHAAELARRERLRAVRGRQERYADLTARHRDLVDRELLEALRPELGPAPTLVEVARWTPWSWHWVRWLKAALHDALAATALLRTALSVAELGPADGLAAQRELIAAGPRLLSKQAARAATRRVPGLTGLPARPGVYLRQLDEHLTANAPSAANDAYVRERLARAHDYGLVARDAVLRLVDALGRTGLVDNVVADFSCDHLRAWRAIVGPNPLRPPSEWEQPPMSDTLPSLARRLADRPDADPYDVELPADLLWYAELTDALAQLGGHRAAQLAYRPGCPDTNIDPPTPEPDPLRPPTASVALALAGAAQLVALGAEVPRKARTWTELVDGMLAAAVVAEARTGTFPGGPVAALDGTRLPGPGLRVEVAREARTLADWAAYMGNCIAGEYYLRDAMAGRCALVALRDEAGRVVANVELVPHRTGWTVGEFRARFNTDPGPELDGAVRAWVAGLAAPDRPRPRPAGRPHPRPVHRPHRRGSLVRDVGEPLADLAVRALAAGPVVEAVAVLDGTTTLAGLTVPRRARADRLDAALRECLTAGAPDLATLWRVTSARPLADALAALNSELRERFGRVDVLLTDGPLPSSPRRLARVPEVARARAVDLVARRLRGGLGRLARAADPALAPAVARHADPELLCALVIAVSTAATVGPDRLTPVTAPGARAVPGFPASTLDTPPWTTARAAAVELGADLPADGVPGPLAVPTDWLGPGGWPALWARAARTGARARGRQRSR
jgi:hypothetical protein